jgi:hypothetical protein
VGGSENIWSISGVVLRPHTSVVSWRYITFRDGEQGRGTSGGMIKVSEFVTFSSVWPWSATWFVLLVTLSHVCNVSFVCSLALVHVFRGSL